MKFIAACLITICPALGFAQTVGACDWRASAENLVEPWGKHTRQFANGDVRVAYLDVVEPAAGAAYLLVLSPPLNELGMRQCKVIGAGSVGFGGMDFAALSAEYDPAQGLILTVPVTLYAPEAGDFVEKTLRAVLNQSTGDIVASVQ